MANMGLWLRWSWRDLRARWVQVVVIALIIAFGAAVFAGFGGMSELRKASYDLSYENLNFYHLRMQFASGSYVEQGELMEALADIEGVNALETRLIAPTSVDASTEDETILVRGLLVGVDVAVDATGEAGPHVNSIYVDEEHGRNLTAADAGQLVAVVEYKFARYHELEPGGSIRVSGGASLGFVGAGLQPEHFIVQPDTGSFFAEGAFAILFVPLETAQDLIALGEPLEGPVNDVVVRLEAEADSEAVRVALEDRMASSFPDAGFELTGRESDSMYERIYLDAESDQGTMDAAAFLLLLGAAVGAFNLTGRMVEAQRREIGIGMALGVPRRWIAFRPVLVGLQIAVLGTIFGLLLGVLLTQAIVDITNQVMPMPYWDVSFQARGYVQAITLGILLPLIASLIAVWRAVRVAPVDALTSGYLVAKGGGLSGLANRLPLPGRSFTQMPFKNLLRSPWRTLLTILGVAIAILLLVALSGMADTFKVVFDQADHAYRYEGANRVLVNLSTFYPVGDGSGEIAAITGTTRDDGTPLFADAETALLLGSRLTREEEEIDVVLELHDMGNAIWRPNLLDGDLKADEPGIVLSEKAADDLGVWVGDTITLRHPHREGALSFTLKLTDIRVIGIHDNPIRPFVYMDISSAEMMGLAEEGESLTNFLVVSPAEGVSMDEIRQALMTRPAVTSVKHISEFARDLEDFMALLVGFMAVMQFIVLVIAFLIAFNTSSISVDERMRDIATMFAFGLPVRTVTRMQMVENLVIGILGTLVGTALGRGALDALFRAQEKEAVDFHLIITVLPQTLVIAAIIGIVVVGLTPLLSIRRMRKMDLPATLRVVE